MFILIFESRYKILHQCLLSFIVFTLDYYSNLSMTSIHQLFSPSFLSLKILMSMPSNLLPKFKYFMVNFLEEKNENEYHLWQVESIDEYKVY